MIIYLGDNNKDISILKRLVTLKAALGVCDWAGDFKGSDINCSDIMEYVDNRIDIIKNNCKVLKSMTSDEDNRYFDELQSLEPSIKAALSCGVVDFDTVELLMSNADSIPSALRDVLEKVDNKKYLFIA